MPRVSDGSLVDERNAVFRFIWKNRREAMRVTKSEKRKKKYREAMRDAARDHIVERNVAKRKPVPSSDK
jgi:Ser/Thr protein kinase RdoA (MazF antagonist)